MNKKMQLGGWALLSLVLGACGGGGGSGDSGVVTPAPTVQPSLAECFSLTPGNAFKDTETPSISSYVNAQGRTVSLTVNTRETLILGNQTPVITVARLVRRGDGTNATHSTFYRYGSGVLEELAQQNGEIPNSASNYSINYYTDKTIDLSKGVGSSQDRSYTLHRLGTGATTVGPYTRTLKFDGLEDLSIGGKTFKNVCKLTQTANQLDMSSKLIGTSVQTMWVAPGYGIVKSSQDYIYTDGRVPAKYSYSTVATEFSSVSLPASTVMGASSGLTLGECTTLSDGKTFKLNSTPSISSYTTAKGQVIGMVPSSDTVLNGSDQFGETIATTQANGSVSKHRYLTGQGYRLSFASESASNAPSLIAGYAIETGMRVGGQQSIAFVRNSSTSTLSSVTKVLNEKLSFDAVEPLSVGGKSFAQTCRVKYNTTSYDNTTGAVTATQEITRWYAPGYGIVKQLNNATYLDGRTPASYSISMEGGSFTN